MHKASAEFYVETKNGVINRIGKSFINTPPVNFQGGEVKWFDDTKLLKKEVVHND